MLDAIRGRLDAWLGAPTRDQSHGTVTLTYRFASEIPPVQTLRLKVEINTREHFAVPGCVRRPFTVTWRWFSGTAELQTYELDEPLATKLRALYQRRRGRDLFDLWDARARARVDPRRVVDTFRRYLRAQGLTVTQVQFERNLAAKARDPSFLTELGPLLAPGVDYDPHATVTLVHEQFLARLPSPRRPPRPKR